MTQANNSPPVAEQTSEAEKITSQPAMLPPTTCARVCVPLVIALSILALIVALGAGAGVYIWGKWQTNNQDHIRAQLVTRLDALEVQQRTLHQHLDTLTQQQQAVAQQSNSQTTALLKQLDKLQQKVTLISDANANNWLLAQADFLVKMAGRKLWSDQDSLTAIALLKSADASLADMHDPSLINVRRAITADIASLSALTQVDYDGIILQLNQLADQVDNLRLADNVRRDVPDGNNPLSPSLHQWRQNLLKSWHHFMDSFITIRRRDKAQVPLLAPDQDIYLRENIRSRLLIAAQAMPRHQQEVYQQSLDNVSTWVRAYYNTSDASSKAFLAIVEQLSQQDINMDLPDSLQSQPLLDKLVQSRVRGLLAAPAADSATSGTGER